MLSKQRIEELRAIVREKYPDFGTAKGDKIFNGLQAKRSNPDKVFWEPPMYGLPYASTVGLFPERMDLPVMTGITACCGLVSFDKLIGEMTGLWSLAGYTKVERAIFALWLNDNKAPGYTAVICSTGSPDPKKFNTSEEVLIEAGFKPLMRGYNLCHGPNYVTVWGLQLNEDALPPDPTPPVASVKPLPAAPAPAVAAPPKRKTNRILNVVAAGRQRLRVANSLF